MKQAASGLLLTVVLLCTGSLGARDIDHNEALALRQAGTILSLEQITQLALARHAGTRLLEVELDEDDGVIIYEVELLSPAGVVHELEFDARSGALLKDEVD